MGETKRCSALNSCLITASSGSPVASEAAVAAHSCLLHALGPSPRSPRLHMPLYSSHWHRRWLTSLRKRNACALSFSRALSERSRSACMFLANECIDLGFAPHAFPPFDNGEDGTRPPEGTLVHQRVPWSHPRRLHRGSVPVGVVAAPGLYSFFSELPYFREFNVLR